MKTKVERKKDRRIHKRRLTKATQSATDWVNTKSTQNWTNGNFTISVRLRVSYGELELLTLDERMGSLRFLLGFMLLTFSVVCVVFFVLFVCVLYLVPSIARVSGLSILDCLFGFLYRLFRLDGLHDLLLVNLFSTWIYLNTVHLTFINNQSAVGHGLFQPDREIRRPCFFIF